MTPRGLAAAIGLVAIAEAGAAMAQAFTHTVRPRGLAEECLKLAAGQTIAYTFQASAPVNFNIHYHRGNNVEYPVKRDQVRDADDRFTAPSAEEYCLMWTNRTLEMVTVKGRLQP